MYVCMYVCACVRDVDIHVTCVHVQVLKENGDSAVLNKLTYSLLDTDVHRLSCCSLCTAATTAYIYIYIYIYLSIYLSIYIYIYI